MKKRLFIIDGHALCYRAYYAFIRNPLVNSDGQNTSAIFGFARMLLKLIADQKPDYLAVAFDPPRKSFRFALYPEYKANRQKMPDDLRSQIEEIKRMIEVLGITRIEEADFEADDVLGTVAKRYGSRDLEVMLVTGDKDAYQLVDGNVKIYNNKKGISEYEVYGAGDVESMLGVRPEQVVDYMALAGDSSDNIPGVKGIGEKSAQKLIAAYGTLDNLYANIEKISGKQKEMLIRDRDMAYLSRDLATVRTDLSIGLDIETLRFEELPPDKAVPYFKKLEMGSIIRDFFGSEAGEEAPAEPAKKRVRACRVIRTEDELRDMISQIRLAGEVSLDTETTSLAPVEAELVGMSFSIREGEGWYVPLLSQGMFSEDYLDPSRSLELLAPLLTDASVSKIGQNIKYDRIVLMNYGIDLAGVTFDTMVASYLLAPNERRHNLDDMAEKYLNCRTVTFKELVGTGKNAVPLAEVPLDRVSEYAVEDAEVTYRLYALFRQKLADEDLVGLFRDVEMPLVAVLAEMERVGVKIDAGYFKKLEAKNRVMLGEVEEKIYDAAEQRFNINSTRELSHVLFERLRLKPQRKTKTGLSTDIRVLESLQGSHPIIDHLISYRTLSKLKNTYIDTLPNLVSPKTGRIHTSYNQTVVATGRLSSSDPNLQNIPVRDEFGKSIRRGFVPEKGHVLMSADYSQIELRVVAHLSGDENMIRAFSEGIDIHSMTASSVFGVPLDGVTPVMRRQAKVINFATIYGVSPFGLSQQAEIGMKEAAEFIRIYFQTYPRVKEYLDTTIEFARKHGFVRTLLGRKREIPEIDSETSFRREGAERVAINTPIQGTAADMIKIAMINISDEFRKKKMETRMIMQVHDELVFEVPEEERDAVEKIVRDRMENALDLKVPIKVDIGAGKNWEEAH
ncbi:MAG: DNA polymerase I [Spirochaetes bacterium RBG_13_51_14]|nr:MAG: DNA polymerase I [Spirochaetes bacterium RBG_13_51_14]